MKIDLRKIGTISSRDKIMQAIVFVLIFVAIGWCFWVYYYTTNKIHESGDDIQSKAVTVSESKLEKVKEIQEERSNSSTTPPTSTRNIF